VNPNQVKTWAEVEGWLYERGFTPTSETTDDGGRIWRSKSKRHLVVPDHIDGYYPDYLWKPLVERAMQIVP